MHSFTQIKKAADKLGTRLVLANLSPELRAAFRSLTFVSDNAVLADDLDHALEFCERAVIAAHSGEGWETRGLRRWFTTALGDANYAEQLMASCERLEVREGEIIASQGDVAACMHFILEGRVSIIVKLEGRTLNPLTQPRTTHYDRRDGTDHAAGAQRHHPGRKAECGLFSKYRCL